MGNASTLAGMLLLFGVVSTNPATAQTATSPDGAFERLSAGNQKIARALFEAQPANMTPAAAKKSATATASKVKRKTMTLDEIAAQKHGGHGWAQIFKNMQSQGLVTDNDLGQVLSRYEQRQKQPVSASLAGKSSGSPASPSQGGAKK